MGHKKTFLKLVGRFLCVVLLAAHGSMAVPQNPRDSFPPNLFRYLKDRYPQIDDEIISDLHETPQGLLGHLNISGRIVLETAAGGTPEGRARRTALAFIQAESAILGVSNPAELKELKEMELMLEENGEASIRYVRTIGGLQLLESSIHIRLDAQGAITRVYAVVRPVSPELRQALQQEQLTLQDVRKIIERDLLQRGKGAPVKFIAEPEEVATWQPPYAVWAATASVDGKPGWSFMIDAFTGEIRSRSCTAFTEVEPGEATPCD